MKNKNIENINKLGKVIRILSQIAKVFCIIGAVLSILGGICVAAIGDDFIKFNGKADASISIDIDKIPFASNENIKFGIVSNEEKIVIDEENIEFGDIAKFDISSIEENGDIYTLNVDGDLSVINVKKIKNEIIAEIFAAAIVCIATAVTLSFAVRLAKAIETCSSPFTEDIVKKMKSFGYSLIPPAALGGIANGSLLTMAIFAIVIIIMIYIFSYGTQLQQENDDMV